MPSIALPVLLSKFSNIFYQVPVKISDFLTTCATSQFYIALKLKMPKEATKHIYLQTPRLEQAWYFLITSPLIKGNDKTPFNSLLITIGGSNDIYICLGCQWSVESLCHLQLREVLVLDTVLPG